MDSTHNDTPLQVEAVVVAVTQVENGLAVAPETGLVVHEPRGIAHIAPAARKIVHFLTSEPVKATAKGAALVALGVGLELAGQQVAKGLNKNARKHSMAQRQQVAPTHFSPTPLPIDVTRRLVYREVYVYHRIERWIIEPRKEQDL